MNDADRFRHPTRLVDDGTAAGMSAKDRLLIVVRHGDAGDKGSWDGPDLLRPLSPAGRRQAEGLLLRLEDYPVERILSSPTVRCRQTVEPLAHDRLLQVESVAALGVDAGPPSCDPSCGIGGCWKLTAQRLGEVAQTKASLGARQVEPASLLQELLDRGHHASL